jgi:hypothetical protein
MKFFSLVLFLILAHSVLAQNSVVREADTQRVKVPDTVVRPVIRISPDSLRRLDSLKQIKDSIQKVRDSILHTLVEKKQYSVEKAYAVSPFPSVYGQWTGGFLKNDKRYNVTAPVPRVREIVRVPPSFEWVFYLFCGVLLLLSFLRLSFYKFFTDLFKVFFNTSMRQKQIKEQLSQSPLPSLMLNIFFFITGGIFIYFLAMHYGYEFSSPLFLTVLICIGALALLYLGKFMFMSLAGWLFDKKAASDNYLFTVFMVNKMAGLFLLPMDILMAYSERGGREVVITLTIIGLVILGIVRMVRGFQSVSNSLRINPIHFITYVAAFEVIPVLLIYKVLLVIIR